LRKKALALIGPILDAQKQSIESTQKQRGADINAAYAALAQIARQQAPVVQGAYQNAANATGTFAKGFTNQVTADQAAAAAGQQANLGPNSPQSVTSGFTQGGGDALYATGGYIPASTLAREGAAFTSAASMFPQTAMGLGVQAQKTLAAQALQQIQELEAKRPGLLMEALDSLRQNDLQRYTVNRNNRLAQLEFGAKNKQATAAGRAAAQKEQVRYQQWLAEMGLKQEGLSLRQQKYALDVWKAQNPASARKAKKPRFTAAQIQKYSGVAASIADTAFYGGEDDDGLPLDPLDYADAVFEMEKEGIPAWIALKYLNQFYSPGQRGRPDNTPAGRVRRNRTTRRNRPPGR
jgi:hypothetical protein